MCSSCSLRGGVWPRFLLELHYLARCWRSVLLGALVQLLHSTFTNVVYYMHEPTVKVLKDNGFRLLGGLIPPQYDWVTEVFFFALFITFFVVAFSPILLASRGVASNPPPFSTTLCFRRMLITAGFAACLRIVSFLATILPSPAPHCHVGSPDYDPPTTWVQILFRLDGIKVTTLFIQVKKKSDSAL